MTRRGMGSVFLLAAALVALPRAGWAQPAAAAGGASREEAANAAMETWTKQGEAACAAKEPACAGMDSVLFNAAVAYESAGRLDLAMAVRKRLVDPRFNLDRTDAGIKTIHVLGQNHQSIGDYDAAAGYYEDFARKAPKEREAPEALSDAVVLRLGLGQIERAIEDANLFSKNYGSKSPARAAQVGLAIAGHHVERQAFKDAKKQLVTWMSTIDRGGAVDTQILAHTWLARALAGLGDTKGATAEYAQVRALWRDPALVIRALEKEDPGNLRRLGKALTGLGEATFFFAEQKRAEADAVRFPAYKGPGTNESIMDHIHKKVSVWVKAKQEAITAAEKEYQKVLQIQPMPPPQWVVASAARVGMMWGKFVAEFRAAPIPEEWRRKGSPPGSTVSYAEIRQNYYRTLDEASQPQRQRAKAAYRSCVDYSVKYQYTDAYSRGCANWLSKSYRAEFPPVDEFIPALRGTPTRFGRASPLPEPGAARAAP